MKEKRAMKIKKIRVMMISILSTLVLTLTACEKSLKEDLVSNSWYFTLENQNGFTQELDFTEDKIIVGIGMLKQQADYKFIEENKIEMLESSGRKVFVYFTKTDTGYNLVIEYPDVKNNNTDNAKIIRRTEK